MATIPIEVIVQDAEAPIVPGEDGTNTNITVPDTGTVSSSGDTSSSASSIILPAILLVLAIGSIVAILIHKYHKQKKDKTNKKEKLAMVANSTIAVLAATVLVSNIVLPATKAATSDITDGITPSEDKISITVTRDGGSAEESIESKATITSTSDFGYRVLLSMAEGVGTSNLYLDGDITSQYYIAPVEAESEEEVELADNTWGFALTEDGGYSAIPLLANAATVAQGNEPVEDESLSIYYGVKVSSDLPAGTYSAGEIEYTLEAKEPTLPIAYMQDFATLSEEDKIALISSMPKGYQFTLKDNRDQKEYFVSKLADGNVWMTQNLDLDIEVPAGGSIVYDSTNTNLPANTTWEPERATIAKDDLSSDTWQDDNYNPYSYDPGDVYYYTSGSNTDDTKYESLEACTGANHTEAECRHYHAGNYYNWTTAIASNDSSGFVDIFDNADASICPAGWNLPVGPNNEDENYGDMINLIQSYSNIIEDTIQQSCGSGLGQGCDYYNYLSGGLDAIRANPLWLIRAGSVGQGSIRVEGKNGSYWSRTVGSSSVFGNYAYAFEVEKSKITPASGNARHYGASIRCVAE